MNNQSGAIIFRSEQSALKTLRADTSIVILPADKGRSTVVLNKTDYIQKADTLLEYRQAYLPCDDEPMKELVMELYKKLADMQKSKAINDSVRLAIKPPDAAAAIFYGLPGIPSGQSCPCVCTNISSGETVIPKFAVAQLGCDYGGLFSNSIPGAAPGSATYCRRGHLSLYLDPTRPVSRNEERTA
ncbi:unnamed protein product [Schistocephalus solidus]|uniref:TSPc domain-containing protein n=1 Tax=Schistocephalus solidus TaxID=70667 RepID=A0A183T2E0_SCHSO|nr:unnamed protein product [Schistocephalus solidus]